ncbi:MAG: hypothetical protein OCD76_17845 [Reichenbachiella sp.]
MTTHDPKCVLIKLGEQSFAFYADCLKARGTSFTSIDVDFDAINMHMPYGFKKIQTVLEPTFQEIKATNPSSVIFPNISIYQSLMSLSLSLPIIDPVTETVSLLQKHEVQEVVLIGSIYTMTGTYISERFHQAGIAIQSLPGEMLHEIDAVRKSVYADGIDSDGVHSFQTLVKELSKQAPIVVACTELSVALNGPMDNVYDMALIQMDAV